MRSISTVLLAAGAFAALFAISAVAGVSWAACGDGVIEAPGEQCDDGNVADGDCCSGGCGFEAEGSPCNSSDLCFSTAAATCDSAGACLARSIGHPDSCPPDTDAHTFIIVDSATEAAEKVRWKQGRVSAELLPLGDPTTTTRYGFCAYVTTDMTFFPSEGSVVFSSEIAPGPAWSETSGGTGWMFRGGRNTPGSVRQVSIGGREARLGSFARFRAISVDGVGLPGPVDADSYFNIGPSVGGLVVGLVNDEGLCLLTAIGFYSFSHPIVVNTPARFKAHLGYEN